MALSVCIIARNEEKNLARAIKSVSTIADEVIVTDTGSTDATAEIAADLGARVSRFEWCDDFAAAYNFAFSQAKSDWIFWLDADEELLPQSCEVIRGLLKHKENIAYHVIRRDLTDISNPDSYTEMLQLRLFRRLVIPKLVGRYHAHFLPDLDEIASKSRKKVKMSRLIINHYGYLGEMQKSKLERSVRIIELELKERPGQIYFLIELGMSLLRLQEPRHAEVLLEASTLLVQHKSDAYPPTGIAAILLNYLMAAHDTAFPDGLTRSDIYDMGSRWFPKSAPLLWAQAQNQFAAEKYESAADSLERLVEAGRTGDYDKMVSFDPRIMGDDAKLNLAVCYIRMAELDKAQRFLTELLSSPSRGSEAKANLAVVEQLRTMYG